MSQAKVTAAYLQGVFAAQGVEPDAAQLAAYASSLQAVLQAARAGFAALDFEAEPAAFQAQQARNAP